ncbi:MAG TPA: hypothetical protein VF228_07910 [Iamia sp.]
MTDDLTKTLLDLGARRRWDDLRAAVNDLVHTQDPRAAEAIAAVVREVNEYEGLPLLSVLGWIPGPATNAVLRSLLAADVSRNMRRAAMTSLAIVAGIEAEDDVREELVTARSASTRTRALLALCITGGGSAWDDVLAALPKVMRSPPFSPSMVKTAVAYMVVHRGDDAERAKRLSTAIARYRPKMDEEDGPWVDSVWPADDVVGAQEWMDHAVTFVVGRPPTA